MALIVRSTLGRIAKFTGRRHAQSGSQVRRGTTERVLRLLIDHFAVRYDDAAQVGNCGPGSELSGKHCGILDEQAPHRPRGSRPLYTETKQARHDVCAQSLRVANI